MLSSKYLSKNINFKLPLLSAEVTVLVNYESQKPPFIIFRIDTFYCWFRRICQKFWPRKRQCLQSGLRKQNAFQHGQRFFNKLAGKFCWKFYQWGVFHILSRYFVVLCLMFLFQQNSIYLNAYFALNRFSLKKDYEFYLISYCKFLT